MTEHHPPRGKGPYRVLVEDETGDLSLVFFRANQAWVRKALPLGAARWISGLVEIFDFYRQMVHPDRILDRPGSALPPVEPVYGLTEGLYQRVVAKAAAAALARLPNLPEWLEERGLRLGSWESFADRLAKLHHPSQPQDLAPEGRLGCGWPMTNCCRTSSRCGWCGPRCRPSAAARKKATASWRHKSSPPCPSN